MNTNIKNKIDFALTYNKNFRDKVLSKVSLDYRYQNNDPNLIYLNKQDIQRYLSPLRNGYIELKQFYEDIEDRLSRYWNQIYKIKEFKGFIDSLLQEQQDRIKLLTSTDIREIKNIISKYGIKQQTQNDLLHKGIQAISDEQLLKRCYENLKKEQKYDDALYIADILNNNQLKKQIDKDRTEQLTLFARKIKSYKDLIKIISFLH